MKNSKAGLFAILFVLALFAGACTLKAQTAGSSPAAKPNCTVTASGNFVAVTHKLAASQSSDTGKTFTDSKGKVYPVYKGSKGGLYYIKTSAGGNDYRVYLKTE